MKPFVPAALLLCFCVPSRAQTPAPKASSTKPKTTIDESTTRQMVTRVLRETSALRELPIRGVVQSRVQSRAQIERMLGGKIQSELSTRRVLGSELFLRQLGLAPANFNLKSTYIRMMGEQIAGYYDTRTQTFTTLNSIDAGQLETIMAHELTHALQDQHFDLSRLENWPPHDSDAQIAMSALVEGDATLAMSRYMAKNPLRFMGVLASALKSQSASPTFDKAPRILRETVTFPYFEGLKFATQLHTRGGWSAVSAAYKRLPQSSEQILHFEKYLAREAPVRVELRDLNRALGAGWTRLDHDVNGELGLFLILAEKGVDEAGSKRAAAGWAGDRYQVYRGSRGALVVQDCRFDSQFDAREWREAYARKTAKRFGSKAQQRGALQVWNAAPNGVWMEQRGNRVLILEGTVGAFNSTNVLTELWR